MTGHSFSGVTSSVLLMEEELNKDLCRASRPITIFPMIVAFAHNSRDETKRVSN